MAKLFPLASLNAEIRTEIDRDIARRFESAFRFAHIHFFIQTDNEKRDRIGAS